MRPRFDHDSHAACILRRHGRRHRSSAGHFRKGLAPERLEQGMAERLLLLNRFLDLTEAGVDWYAEIIKACRRRGVAPWVSFRMNNMHGSNDWAASSMNAPWWRPRRTG
jgi:hypothetical protein